MSKDTVLTPASIDKLAKGSIADPAIPGLCVIVAGPGKKVWRFKRVVAGTKTVLELRLGCFPDYSIADARAWARPLAESVAKGIDPRVAEREKRARMEMTVVKAHGIYMAAMRRGDRKKLKPRTISDKDAIYTCDIAPRLGSKPLDDLSRINAGTRFTTKPRHRSTAPTKWLAS